MLEDIISKHSVSFAPGVHTELRAQVNKSRRVTLLAGNLTANSRSDVSGVSARVYKNGVYGFSSVAEMSDDAVKAVLKEATSNADFMDRHIAKGKALFPAVSTEYIAPGFDDADVPQKDYIDFIRMIDDYIAGKYKGLTSRAVVSTSDSMEKLLCTSDRVSGHTAIPRSYIYVFLNAETPSGVPVELFKAFGGSGSFYKHFSSPDTLYAGIDALYEKLMQKREGIYPEAGLKTCVLGGELAGMLAHEAVGHTVEADLVLGGSVAASSLGKQVASELVSLTDFANTAFAKEAPLPVYVDDEGIAAVDSEIIKDGILVGYMNNRETAEHFGMKPQGNARAYLFSDEPLIRMRNTAIHPGTSKLEDIIASVDDGYYLVDTQNGQADTTGEFMFGISMGYEIKNGKLGRAILDTTISGVAFEMLKTVDMVSDNVSWSSSGFCGKKQPMPVGLGGPEVRCKVMIGGR